MPDPPRTSPINLLAVNSRAQQARQVLAGSLAAPALVGLRRQVDAVLSDIPALTAEIAILRDRLTGCRIDRANVAAAGRATITAYRDGEPDPLAYLQDELHAQGFGVSEQDRGHM